MKAEDLRIGNKFECMGMIQTVFEICDNTDRGRIKQNGYEHIIRCIENGNQYKPIEINYIPLSEEWLLRFGFKLCDVCNDFECLKMPYYANNAVLLFFNSNRTKYELSDYYIGYGSMRDGKYHVVAFKWIKYVHQLQNLYFALTGDELITAIA